jgi:hypothetical protein
MTFMSSPKPAPSLARRKTPPPAKATAKLKPSDPPSGLPADAKKLAAALERALADGQLDVLPPDALQALMSALCRTYSAQVENGQQLLPVRERTGLNSTEVMTTASGLLKAANLAVFELGMWQSWTGR